LCFNNKIFCMNLFRYQHVESYHAVSLVAIR
jgi:hypothetical protein